MGSYIEYRDAALARDPALKAEYDALEPEYDIIQALIAARSCDTSLTDNDSHDTLHDLLVTVGIAAAPTMSLWLLSSVLFVSVTVHPVDIPITLYSSARES